MPARVQLIVIVSPAYPANMTNCLLL